eukprot:NODE_26750_length_539_cov_2.703883.p1 GENE.NODE_26750_length_539_cov_2.703883~~NODE_26750_length_539_cov_2.703883.p1  ORF type:complete len:96 (-),score=35.79 NODE_26750_length_539_cov_2.703883:210-497(-)
MATHIFKRLPVGGRVALYSSEKIYRAGGSVAAAAVPALTKLPVSEALEQSKTKVTFLEVGTLKGTPVSSELSTKSIDPYFAAYLRDFNATHFGGK